MSSQGKRFWMSALSVAAVVAFLGSLHWITDPAWIGAAPPESPYIPECEYDNCNGGGSPPPPPPLVDPETSIVFVIDSSMSMFPRYGPDYFELAKDGIAEFLKLPGFPTNGSMEVAVIQFARLDAPGYFDHTHWISPGRITSSADHSGLINLVLGLEQSLHYTASLMEIGIREASHLLNEAFPSAPGTTDRHLILLTTGEYRLPYPCPPPCYGLPPDHECWAGSDCANEYAGCFEDQQLCNRACHIREFAMLAREEGITVSAVRLGQDWRNNVRFAGGCAEAEEPYGNPPDFCTEPLPGQPDRDGFLKEIANTGGCVPTPISCTSDDDCPGSRICVELVCTASPIGKNVRVNPFYTFGCSSDECQPGRPRDIAEALASWFSEWDPTDTDGDSVPDIADNCPDEPNPRQRDCDLNGMGDTCQWTIFGCGSGSVDTDCDGLPGWDDLCAGGGDDDGGDDCLVNLWLEGMGCEDPSDPNHCGCDCDHDGFSDACQAARAIRGATLPDPDASPPTSWDEIDTDMDGIADCCQTEDRLCQCGTDLSALCFCRPIAPLCNPNAMPNGEYLEDFSETFADTASGAPAFDGIAELLDDGERYGVAGAGWWLVGMHPATKYSVIVVEDTGHSDDSEDRAIEIALDETEGVPTDGSYSWFLEGPGLQVPLGRCLRTVCDHHAFRGVPGDYDDPVDGWSVLAVEMDLWINNEDNGPTYDFYVLDPCVDDFENAKRIHLRFRDHPDPGYSTKGLIEYELFPYWDYDDNTPIYGTPGYGSSPAYPMREWFALKLAININPLYQYSYDLGCHYVGDRDTIRIYKKKPHDAADSAYTQVFSGRIEELGHIVPEQPRGVQLHIRTNNKKNEGPEPGESDPPPDILRIDNINVRRIEPCEWLWGQNCKEYENNEDAWCACGHDGTQNNWHCTIAPCGNGIVDIDSGEQCDPPDYEHCSTFCQWICGDGVVQGPEVSGDEQCEWPGHLADPSCGYCNFNCECGCVCGDGFVDLECGEECDGDFGCAGGNCADCICYPATHPSPWRSVLMTQLFP